MRRTASSAVATALAAVLLLAGCSSAGTDDEATPASTSTATATEPAPAATAASDDDIAALETVAVDGEAGAEPSLTFEQPLAVTAPVARLVAEGTGNDLAEGQVLSVHFVTVDGADGATVGSTYEAEPESLVLGDPQVVPALTEALTGQKVGSRVLFATPGPEGATLMVIDVVGAETVLDRAEGESVTPADGLPTVTLSETGEPSIEPASGEPPAELVVQPLIEGDGPVIESGQTVTMHYSGWLWDGTPFDSSWSKGTPFVTPIGAGRVIEGWDTGLVGQKVGSQVMLVVPPELGYGDTANGPIPAGSTLVFVVDILHVG